MKRFMALLIILAMVFTNTLLVFADTVGDDNKDEGVYAPVVSESEDGTDAEITLSEEVVNQETIEHKKALSNTENTRNNSDIPAISLGDNSIVFDTYDGTAFVVFTPDKSGLYEFTSTYENGDPYGYLYADENMENYLIEDDDSGEGLEFNFSYELEAGVPYYLYVSRCYYDVPLSVNIKYHEETYTITFRTDDDNTYFADNNSNTFSFRIPQNNSINRTPSLRYDYDHYYIEGYRKDGELFSANELKRHVPQSDEEWTVEWGSQYVVNFYRNYYDGDTNYSSRYVKNGNCISNLPGFSAQTGDNLVIGSFVDEDGREYTSEEIKSLEIHKDTDFYAQWIDAYQVTFDAGTYGYMYEDDELGYLQTRDVLVGIGKSIDVSGYKPYMNDDSDLLFAYWTLNGARIDNENFVPEGDVTLTAFYDLPQNMLPAIGLGDNLIDVNVEESSAFVVFTPDISGLYEFTSTYDGDPYGYLYSDYKKRDQLVRDDDSGEGYQFKFLYELEAGVPYFLYVYGCYDDSPLVVNVLYHEETYTITLRTEDDNSYFVANNNKNYTFKVPHNRPLSSVPSVTHDDDHYYVKGYRKDDLLLEKYELSQHVPQSDEEWTVEWGYKHIITFYRNYDSEDTYVTTLTRDDGRRISYAPEYTAQGNDKRVVDCFVDEDGEEYSIEEVSDINVYSDMVFRAKWMDAYRVTFNAGDEGYMEYSWRWNEEENGNVKIPQPTIDVLVGIGKSINVADYEPYINEDSELVFAYWTLDGARIDGGNFVPEGDVTLTAFYDEPQNVLPVVNIGDNPIALDLDKGSAFVVFTPNKSGLYEFTSTHVNGDPYGYLYSDVNRNNQLVSDDDSAGSLQFRILCELEAGVPYYLYISNCNKDAPLTVNIAYHKDTYNITFRTDDDNSYIMYRDIKTYTFTIPQNSAIGRIPYASHNDYHYYQKGYVKDGELLSEYELKRHVPQGDEEWTVEWGYNHIIKFYRNYYEGDTYYSTRYRDDGYAISYIPTFTAGKGDNRVVGFFTDESGEEYTYDELSNLEIHDDMAFYAQWIDAYKVTFDAGDNGYMYKDYNQTPIQTQDILVVPGDKINVSYYEPFINDGSDMIFSHWEYNGVPVNGEFEPTENETTLEAVYQDAYIIRLHANSPYNDEIQTIKVNPGDSIGWRFNSPQYGDPSYGFAGYWSTNSNGGGTLYYNSSLRNYVPTGNMDLYAAWEKRAVVTCYAGNNGYFSIEDGNYVDVKQYSYIPETIIYPEYYLSTPSPYPGNGAIFDGWYTDSSCAAEYRITTSTITVQDDMSLYAGWISDNLTITISFDANGGYFNNQQTTYTASVSKGQAYDQYIPYPYTEDEYHRSFASKWNTQADGKGNSYNDSDIANLVLNNDLVLYAMWDEYYKITLDANGGSFDEGSIEYTKVMAGHPLSEVSSLTTPQDDERIFVGWSTNKNATSPEDLSLIVPDGDSTIYAVWRELGGELAIEPEELTIKINQTRRYTAVPPIGISEDDIVWRIDDDTIATIDEDTGEVTGKAEGQATISASLSDEEMDALNQAITDADAAYQQALEDEETAQTLEQQAQTNAEQKDAAYQTALGAEQTAQNAYNSSVSARQTAQTDLQNANDAKALADQAVTDATTAKTNAENTVVTKQQELAAAQANASTAQSELTTAQQNLASYQAEMASKLNSYEFFKWLSTNGSTSDVRQDAARAVRLFDNQLTDADRTLIMNNGSVYAPGTTPKTWAELYSKTTVGSEKDATTWDYFKKALNWAETGNTYRAKENLAPLKISSTLMAMAQFCSNYTSRVNKGHTLVFGTIENLGYGGSSAGERVNYNPYVGWYDDEKAIYDSNGTGTTGHYQALTEKGNYGPYNITGYGYSVGLFSGGTDFVGTNHAQHFGNNSSIGSGLPVSEYKDLLQDYENSLTARETELQGVVNAKQNALNNANNAVSAAQTALSNAQQAVTDAETNLQTALSNQTAAANEVSSKQATLNEKLADESNKLSAYESAQANTTATLNAKNQADNAYADAQSATTEATNNVAAKQELLSIAQFNYQRVQASAVLIVKPIVTGVTVEPSEVVLYVGDSTKVTETVLPTHVDNKNVSWASNDVEIATVDNNGNITAVKVGDAIITVTTEEEEKTTTVNVRVKAKVDVPTAKTGLVYNGENQVGVESGTHYTVKSKGSGTNAGDYTAEVSLINTTHYVWSDESIDDKEITWSIAPKSISGVTVTGIEDKPYTGSPITQTPIVKDGTTTLSSGIDYTVSYENNTNEGTATVIIKGKGNYTGTKADVTFEITHNLVKVDAKDATCVEDGNKEHWQCIGCNKLFSDSEGNIETTKDKVSIVATGHAWGEVTYTWSTDNKSVTATRTCGKDESHFETETVSTTSKDAKDATCTEKGKTTYTATFTNTAFTKQTTTIEDIAPLGHDWKAATCTSPKTCSRCKTAVGGALGHSYGTWTVIKKATCGAAGKEERVCANDKSHKETRTIKATGKHTWDKGKVTKAATTSATGVKTYTCTVCKTTKTETIPKLQIKDVALRRLYGEGRYATALAIAETYMKETNQKKLSSIIVACGKDFPDALSAAYLAKSKNAPVIIWNESNNALVQSFIKKNVKSKGTIYLLGGTGAVGDGIKKNMSGYKFTRIADSNRYGTNIKVLESVGIKKDELLVCDGTAAGNGINALIASATGKPMLLVGKDGLRPEQKQWLSKNKSKITKITIIGDTNSVNAAVEKELKAYKTVSRIKGKNGDEISAKVAKQYYKNAKEIFIATMDSFPDGLCGGPLAITLKGPMLLVNEKTNKQSADYAKTLTGLERANILGGSSAVSDKTARKIAKNSKAKITEVKK